MEALFARRIIFVGGKGGVGKTTTAASLAILAARKARRCLVVSTDPAHSLGDIFDLKVGDEETPLGTNLWGLEIDPDATADRHIATVKASMKDLVHPRMYSAVDRQLDLARHAPGAAEAALLERVTDLMAEAGDRFQTVIFDTAPTGHTLRLLSLPEVMAAWTDGLLKHQESSRKLARLLDSLGGGRVKGDELSLLDDAQDYPKGSRSARIVEILAARRRKFVKARQLLLDADVTAFLMVLTPEKLPILETKKARDLLHHYRLPITAVIVNRVLPQEADGAFLETRRQQEEIYRQEIERQFAKLPRIYIPLMPRDVHGVEALERFGRLLMARIESIDNAP